MAFATCTLPCVSGCLPGQRGRRGLPRCGLWAHHWPQSLMAVDIRVRTLPGARSERLRRDDVLDGGYRHEAEVPVAGDPCLGFVEHRRAGTVLW